MYLYGLLIQYPSKRRMADNKKTAPPHFLLFLLLGRSVPSPSATTRSSSSS